MVVQSLYVVRNAIGLIAMAAVIAGVYGLAGWEWAAILAGLPFAAFYLWGEWRVAQTHRGGE